MTTGDYKAVFVRIDTALLERCDAYQAAMAKRQRPAPSRADVFNVLLGRALDEADRKAGATRKV